MKTKLNSLLLMLMLTSRFVLGQGTFIFDQQATNIIEGAAFLSRQPMGQSFTPAQPSVGFVALYLYDADAFNTAGATVYVNLRSTSITGPILGSSDPVFMAHDFLGTANFLFSTPVAVTPGVIYYFQPVIQSGDAFGSYVTDGSYTGGTAFANGVAFPNADLWFQEGVMAVPEPSSGLLLLIGLGAMAGVSYVRKAKRTRQAQATELH